MNELRPLMAYFVEINQTIKESHQMNRIAKRG